jgi:CMP-N,N'-diacetyllegionaminic acid synthase
MQNNESIPLLEGRLLCVISARGGSKGVPGKNIRHLLGKPLITWAIQKALLVPRIDRVVVSTDCSDIANIARDAGADVPFIRPAELSTSEAGKFQVWQHALKTCEQLDKVKYDLYVDIDCTNPLLEVADIEGAIDKYRTLNLHGMNPDAVFTVSDARRNPYFNLVEPDSDGILKMSKNLSGLKVLARQFAPEVFEHVAGTYVLSTSYLRVATHLLDGRAFGYKIPSEKAFDVDTQLDFILIEHLLKLQMGLK